MNQQVLDDLMQDCPCDHSKWCFLRELLKHTGVGEREAEHMRLVFDYKFIQSADKGGDIGEERALDEWVKKGYAATFITVYKPEMRHEDLKYKIFIEQPPVADHVSSVNSQENERDPIMILEETWKKKSINQQVLDDLMQDCPCDHSKWCFLRELLKHTGVGDREAEQIRMIYALKFIMSKREGSDVGEKRALGEWIEGGYASRFRGAYHEGIKHEELKYKLFIEQAPAIVGLAK